MSYLSGIASALPRMAAAVPVPAPRTRRRAYDFGGVSTLEDRDIPLEEKMAESRIPMPESRMPIPLAATTPIPASRMPEPPTPYDEQFESAGMANPYEAPGAPARRAVDTAITRMSAPAATIDSDPDIISSRLRTPPPDFIGDFKRTSRMDPNLQRAAMIEQGVSPQQYDYLHPETPRAEPVYPERREVKRGGFLGTLKHIGRGALQGVALGSSAAGGGGAIGGAIAGAIHGGVSPQSVENVDRRINRIPAYESDKASYDRDVANREMIAGRIAGRTGFDPVSGAETPQAENQRESRDIRRMQAEDLADYRAGREEDRDQANRERVARSAVLEAKRMGRPVPLAAVKGTSLEEFGGQMAPTAPRKVYTKTFTGTNGIEYGMLDSGEVEPIRTVDGQPFRPQQSGAAGGLTPSQAINIGLARTRIEQAEAHYMDTIERQDRKDAEAFDKEARSIKGQFELAKKAVTLAVSEYSRKKTAFDTAVGRGQAQAYVDGKFVGQAEVDAAQDKADAAQTAYEGVKQIVGEHPGLEFDQSGEGVIFNSAVGEINRRQRGKRGRMGGGGGGGKVAKEFSAADLPEFANTQWQAGKFAKGDVAAARRYIEGLGYTIK